jgi:hypothetical protein
LLPHTHFFIKYPGKKKTFVGMYHLARGSFFRALFAAAHTLPLALFAAAYTLPRGWCFLALFAAAGSARALLFVGRGHDADRPGLLPLGELRFCAAVPDTDPRAERLELGPVRPFMSSLPFKLPLHLPRP